jgi:hypothetical protein
MNAVGRGNAGTGAVLDGGGVVPESARVPSRWEGSADDLREGHGPFETIDSRV